jgi:hypothetical protein
MGSSLAAVAEPAMSLIKMSMFKVANDEMLFPVECCLNAPNLNKFLEEKISWLPLSEFSQNPFPKTSRNHRAAHAERSQNRSSMARD